jgi:hypothetical protein
VVCCAKKAKAHHKAKKCGGACMSPQLARFECYEGDGRVDSKAQCPTGEVCCVYQKQRKQHKTHHKKAKKCRGACMNPQAARYECYEAQGRVDSKAHCTPGEVCCVFKKQHKKGGIGPKCKPPGFKKGRCIDTRKRKCRTGKLMAGYCPGDSNILCCAFGDKKAAKKMPRNVYDGSSDSLLCPRRRQSYVERLQEGRKLLHVQKELQSAGTQRRRTQGLVSTAQMHFASESRDQLALAFAFDCAWIAASTVASVAA